MNKNLRLTGKLQTGSPAQNSSRRVERHALVHPHVLVTVQTVYNEVAPRQTPPAIQSQIYESPIQRPSVRANTPSVPGKMALGRSPPTGGGVTAGERRTQQHLARNREDCTYRTCPLPCWWDSQKTSERKACKAVLYISFMHTMECRK